MSLGTAVRSLAQACFLIEELRLLIDELPSLVVARLSVSLALFSLDVCHGAPSEGAAT